MGPTQSCYFPDGRQADHSSHEHERPAFTEEEKLERAWTPKTKVNSLNPEAAVGEVLERIENVKHRAA